MAGFQQQRQPLTEDGLGVTRVPGKQFDTFKNANPLWQPPGSRGLFGGCLIAQCLSAAKSTIGPEFTIHSMHCHFLVSGNAKKDVIYEVERLRDGKSFASRAVRALQDDRCIFTTTASFAKREERSGKSVVTHAAQMPQDLRAPRIEDQMSSLDPMHLVPLDVTQDKDVSRRKARWWLKARGPISDVSNSDHHSAAIAYMSDNILIEAIAMIHGLRCSWRKNRGESSNFTPTGPGDVSMMVSLSHAIHFHETQGFRADDWLLSEVESPWSGHERGVVLQKIYAPNGKLIATCYQEGVVRLNQDENSSTTASRL